MEKLTENNIWSGLQPVRGLQADRRLHRKAVDGTGGSTVTGDGRVGVTRYDSPCLGVSQEFRLADQGRQDRCSQPSVSCHTRSLHKTKYASHTLYSPGTRRLHASALSSVRPCCMRSLTPACGPTGNDVVLNLISL